MKDLFGQEMENHPALLPKRKTTLPRGHAAPPGSGPTGETCGSCKNLTRRRFAKEYLKCALMRAHWTGGAGTDVRAKDPACSRWEKDDD